MPFTVLRNDITKMDVDAVVNAANTELLMGGGVCGAIFSAAGAGKLQSACNALSPIQTGEAVITEGFDLTAKFIIHTAGPIYTDGSHNEEDLLTACYVNSLNLAKEHECGSIAFPLISSGIYGYPKDEALSVATNTIGKWLKDNELDVYLVVFDKAGFSLSNKLLGEVEAFINQNYVDEQNIKFERSHRLSENVLYSYEIIDGADEEILENDFAIPDLLEKDEFPVEIDESFSEFLLRLIDAKGKTDVEVYKKANIDRKLFSKIRTGKGYSPSKKTAVALAVALELSLDETRELLEKAGFALSRSLMFDVIIEFFISQGRYNIYEINNVLFEYDQPVLGG